MMNNKLRQAVNAALDVLKGADYEVYKLLLEQKHNECKEDAIEQAQQNGWHMELERPVGERVNPKVFSGKTIYNSWMNEGGITVIFQDFTKYVISGPNYGNIKRVQ